MGVAVKWAWLARCCVMESYHNGDFLESIVSQLIDEEVLGVCFEIHRAIKLGYYELLHPDKSAFEKHDIIDEPGLDVFGNGIQAFRKPVECVCPSCQRTLGASKFAPHLEKCLGMGRTSSRLAHKKSQVSVESEGEHSEDNEEDWTYPEKKNKKLKREKPILPTIPTSRKTINKLGRGQEGYQSNGSNSHALSIENFYHTKPSLQQHNAASFSVLPTELKHHLLQQICGVISERTGRLCTRTIKCPQHSEEDRQEVRRMLLENSDPVEVGGPFHHSTQDQTKNATLDYINDKYTTLSTEETHKHVKKKQRDGSNKKHKKSLQSTY